MKFDSPLKQGRFKKRYKRFFADVELDLDSLVTAHVPNTGSLKGCLQPDSPCRMTHTDDPKRKLKYTLQMIKTETSWVGVNTHLANTLVWELWQDRKRSDWLDFDGGQREVKISEKSRVDLVLWNSSTGPAPDKKISLKDFEQYKFHFVEVKNVTLAEDGVARFPDAVTARGQKHLQELMLLMQQGHSAELVFAVQRSDCHSFSPAEDIDPKYAELLREAHSKGLIVSALPAIFEKQSISLDGDSPLNLRL